MTPGRGTSPHRRATRPPFLAPHCMPLATLPLTHACWTASRTAALKDRIRLRQREIYVGCPGCVSVHNATITMDPRVRAVMMEGVMSM